MANHTWTHRDLSFLDRAAATYEIRHGREVIEEVTGRQVRFFRPPRGQISGVVLKLLAEEDNDLLMWSITGSVPGRERSAQVHDFVLSHLAPGAIVGLHDGIGRGTFDRSSAGARSLIQRRSAEVAALPAILEAGIERGYRFMSVGELLTHERSVR